MVVKKLVTVTRAAAATVTAANSGQGVAVTGAPTMSDTAAVAPSTVPPAGTSEQYTGGCDDQ